MFIYLNNPMMHYINYTSFSKAGFVAAVLFLFSVISFAQEKAPASPPASASGKIGKTDVTINYSSPGVKNRTIGKEIAPYGKVWRTGANAATKITFSTDVLLEGKPLAAGTYALFTIPNEKEWVVIINKTAEQWGAFKYEEGQDALRVTVKPVTSKTMNERMKIAIAAKGKNAGTITVLWGNIAVPFNVKSTVKKERA